MEIEETTLKIKKVGKGKFKVAGCTTRYGKNGKMETEDHSKGCDKKPTCYMKNVCPFTKVKLELA